MKIYISGKITGDSDYKAKFKRAEEKLKAAGHAVMNPAVLPDGFEYYEYMLICITMLDVCDAIYLLTDWRQSEGARKEYKHAMWVGKDAIFEEEENTKEQQVEDAGTKASCETCIHSCVCYNGENVSFCYNGGNACSKWEKKDDLTRYFCHF